jgi:hypothetical protein
MPDFYAININVTIPTPWTATLLGVTAVVAIDRNGAVYGGGGPNGGKAATGVSGSAAAGWVNQASTPTPEGLRSFLTGSAWNIGGGFWGGAGVTYSPSTGLTATNIGLFTPQGGASYSFSVQLSR